MQRFPLVRPKWEFTPICPKTRREKSMTVKPVTPPEWYPRHRRPKIDLHTCDMAPPSFWLDSDAPEPLSGETLAPMEKNKTYTSTAGIDFKRG